MFPSQTLITDMLIYISCFTFQMIIDVNNAYANTAFTPLSFHCEDSEDYISIVSPIKQMSE